MISEKKWQWQYALLHEKARKDPIGHLVNYCTQDTLFNQREKLYEVFSRYFSGEDFAEWPPEDRARFIWFYRTLQEILEAGCRIRELVFAQQLTYTYTEQKEP